MMRRLVSALGAALCILALPGCTAKLVEYSQETEIRDNRVAELTDAWRGAEGRLTICARGWPAERAREAEPADFYLSIPLVRTYGEVRPSPHPGVDRVPVRRIAVDGQAIGDGCPERPEGVAAVQTALLPTDRFGRLSPGETDAEDIARLAGTGGTMLYGAPAEGEPPTVAILYRHDEAIFDGSRMAWIDPGAAEVQPNKGALAALPLAIAADAAGIVFVVALGTAYFVSQFTPVPR